MSRRVLGAALLLLASAGPVSGQRLLEEWRVRPTARPEALLQGAAAVFWNPAQVQVRTGRGEATVLDLHTPAALGIDGTGVAASYALDGRTTIALGLERVGVDGLVETDNSPDDLGELDIGETRFAGAAAHALGEHSAVGAMVQYTRLPQLDTDNDEGSVLALGAGISYQRTLRLPVQLAAMAATEGDDIYWTAGLEVGSGSAWDEIVVSGAWGASGGDLAPGITHRALGIVDWRTQVELSAGVVSEPDGSGRALSPLGSGTVRFGRYRLGAVWEKLPNDFGSAWSFRLAVRY